MRVISFAWTTPALLAGVKTVTRREWKDDYAGWFKDGDHVAAFDRQPRYKGRHIATIRLTHSPIKQSTDTAPESDYEAEGFAWLEEHGFKVDGLSPKTLWHAWHVYPKRMWIVRFELVSLGPEDPTPSIMTPPSARLTGRQQLPMKGIIRP